MKFPALPKDTLEAAACGSITRFPTYLMAAKRLYTRMSLLAICLSDRLWVLNQTGSGRSYKYPCLTKFQFLQTTYCIVKLELDTLPLIIPRCISSLKKLSAIEQLCILRPEEQRQSYCSPQAHSAKILQIIKGFQLIYEGGDRTEIRYCTETKERVQELRRDLSWKKKKKLTHHSS